MRTNINDYKILFDIPFLDATVTDESECQEEAMVRGVGLCHSPTPDHARGAGWAGRVGEEKYEVTAGLWESEVSGLKRC